MIPTREIYWNISGGKIVYLFMVISLALMVWGFWRRWRLWRLGGPEPRTDRPWERVKGFLKNAFAHARQLRESLPGLMHLFIFSSFGILFIATLMIAVEENFGVHFLHGTFYLFYSLITDIFGILGIVGLAIALMRRYIQRPERLDNILSDHVTLALLLAIFLTGFGVESLRMAATELREQAPFAPWSPGGYAAAHLFSSLSEPSLLMAHKAFWWVHAVLAFLFIGYVGWGKLSHIFYSSLNTYLRNLGPSGVIHPIDFEDESIETFGKSKINEYSWKQLLDLDACTRCGRCQDRCPAHLSEKPLSPKKVILDMGNHLAEWGPSLLAGKEPEGGTPLIGGAVQEDEFWSCLTCGGCHEACPVFIEHVPKMLEMRRYVVMMESRMPEDTKLFLKCMDERFHPWKGTPLSRTEWYEGMEVKELSKEPRAELLLWVGCTGSLVERTVKVAQAVARLLKTAGVDFGVLGEEEVCCGDPARRVGGEYTYQIHVQKLIETFKKYDIGRILTFCPHCYNTFKNEYPAFGGEFEVFHHTEFLSHLLREGRLKPSQTLGDGLLTYHDSCYLGRHNGLYEAPREIIRSLPGVSYREMELSRWKGFCCGGGGGHALMEIPIGERINNMRVDQVLQRGASTVALACPFCMVMFDDGIKNREAEGRLTALDIAELLEKAL